MNSENVQQFSFSTEVKIFTGFFLCFIFIYNQSFELVLKEWLESSDYSYGPLIIPISLYMIVRNRSVLSQLQINRHWFPLLGLLACVPVWMFGHLIGVQIIEVMLVFVLFVFLVWAYWGTEFISHIKMPVFLLILSAPIWGPLGVLLQEITSVVSYSMLRILGVPAFIEGHYITVPNGKFEIEQVCGGLRYFLAALVTVLVFVYFEYEKRSIQIYVTCTIVLVSIIANWIRVVIIMMVGHLYGMNIDFVQDHDTFGWVMFAIFLGGAFFLVIRLTRQWRE